MNRESELFAVAVGALLASPGVAFLRFWHHASKPSLSTVVIFGAVLVVLGSGVCIFALDLRARTIRRFEYQGWRPVLLLALIYAMVASPGLVGLGGAGTLLSARICPSSGPYTKYGLRGLLIGETADRVYVGEMDLKHRIASVPLSQVREVFFGNQDTSCNITSPNLLSQIQHIVVIYEENHSFDNLYGGWEGVNGVSSVDPAHRVQVGQDGKPFRCLDQNDVNLTARPSGRLPADCTDSTTGKTFTSAFPNAPFTIDRYISPTATTCPPVSDPYGS